MKKITTTRFGELEVEDKNILYFAEGIPAFEDEHEFFLVITDMDSPYLFLQSLKTPELAFLITRPFTFFPDYTFTIPDKVEEDLELQTQDDMDIYNIITIPKGNIEKMTANLMAPIIVNNKTNKALQLILEKTDYTTKHELFPSQDKEEN